MLIYDKKKKHVWRNMEIMGGFIINFNSNYGHSMLMEFIIEEILVN